MSFSGRIKERIADLRARFPLLDRAFRTQEHYGAVKGNLQAGAVTYFAFLSFFPILALAFAVIGYVAKYVPDAHETLVDAIDEVLPNMVGDEEGQIKLKDIQDAAPGIASVGLVVVLYSGLGWLSAMRDALLVVFEKPQHEQPNLIVGKARDLVAMAALGVVLMVSVAVSGVVRGLSEEILDWVGLGAELDWLLLVVAIAIGLLANMVLFFAFFRLLGKPDLPPRALWSGALLGAIGFELLKQASQYLLKSTASQPAFQAFGIALILVVWINYFSRVVMYAAAWAHVGAGAQESKVGAVLATHTKPSEPPRPGRTKPFAVGALSMLGLIAWLKRRRADPPL